MINIFYKDHLKKLIIIFLFIDFALFMAKLIAQSTTKQKLGQFIKDFVK